MDPFITPTKASDLHNELHNKGRPQNIFNYKGFQNIPHGRVEHRIIKPSVVPTSASPHSMDVVFKIPRVGMLMNAFIKTNATTTGNNSNVEEQIGERLYSLINLRTERGPNLLATQTPEYCRIRVEKAYSDAKLAFNDLTSPSATWSNSAVDICTPLFFWNFEHPELWLPTFFVENLELYALVNTSAGMGLDAAISAFTTELHCFFYVLDEELENSYISRFKEETKLLAYDIRWTSQAIANGATSTSIHSLSKDVVFASHMLIKDSTNQSLGNVTSYKLYLDTHKVCDLAERESVYLLYWKEALHPTVTTDTLVYSLGNGSLSHWFSLSRNRYYESGSVSFDKIQNVRFDATHADPGDGNSVLHLIDEYWKVVKITPTGSIVIELLK